MSAALVHGLTIRRRRNLLIAVCSCGHWAEAGYEIGSLGRFFADHARESMVA